MDEQQPQLSPLEKEIQDVINRHGIHPQIVALSLAEMIASLLSTLAWQPQNVQAAMVSAKETVRHLRA